MHSAEYLQLEGKIIMLGEKKKKKKNLRKKTTLRENQLKHFLEFFQGTPGCHVGKRRGENQLEKKNSIKPPAATYLKRGENQLNILKKLIMNLYR